MQEMSRRRDIVELIKQKLFKKSRIKRQRKVLKPTLCSLFGLGVRFKYCDENLIKNTNNPSVKKKARTEAQSAHRDVASKFISKVSELHNITKLRNKSSRVQDQNLELSKENTQQLANQNVAKFTYSDYEKEGFPQVARLVKHSVKVRYNPAQLSEILATQNPIGCSEYRSPQRNGNLSPHENSRFEQTAPLFKSKIESDEYDDNPNKRTSIVNKTSRSPSRDSTHHRVLSSSDRELLSFNLGQTRAQTASDRASQHDGLCYMVNEYFSDVNSLDFYMKLRQKDRDKQQTRANAKAVEKPAAVSKGFSKTKMTPITSMDKYYRKLWKEREQKQMKHMASQAN